MGVKEILEIKVLLYFMGKGLEEISRTNEDFQDDFEDDEGIIQWKIGDNINMYMEINEGKFTAHLDEQHENPTVTLIVPDLKNAKGILRGEVDGNSAYMAGDLKIEGELPLSMKMGQAAEYLTEALSEIL
ncbi:MAG: SCP2 sterol-binding domain-containing protein [Candidatus Hodarchaeota archaeon]